MLPPGWMMWCILVTAGVPACSLKISGDASHEVICSQGLSDCIMKDVIFINVDDNDTVDTQNLTANFKLCCKDGGPCTLCMVLDVEVNIKEETRNPKASVTACYTTGNTIPVCKKVVFTVNHTALTQPEQAKISMVINRPDGISFGSHVHVYLSKATRVMHGVMAPSLHDVCSQELQGYVEECSVPRLTSVINQKMNRVDLQFADSSESLPSMCVQYEIKGRCQIWKEPSIPLYSVATCTCFQVWVEEDQRSRRALICPFNNAEVFQRNVWQNVSISVAPGLTNDQRSVLWWNVSAPCRLEGEVWPCFPQRSCRELQGHRQQLKNDSWRQNSKGMWERTGLFEDLGLQRSPCVMVQVNGMGRELGPICFDNLDRSHWSLLIVGAMLLVCLTVLIYYIAHDSVKRWVWSWHYGDFVEIGRKRHVVVLSPPDLDDGVSESVCQLGSLFCKQGFSVSVDQWSRNKQCDMGPMPWLHSQLLELNRLGGRVVLVLNHKALERAKEWTECNKEAVKTKGENRGLPQMGSPYSDLFLASLCLIHVDKQRGRAGERFVLVKFDSSPCSDKTLPELLQGLLLFQLPSQTQALLTELTVGRTARGSSRKRWTGLTWRVSDGIRTETEEEAEMQKLVHAA